MKPSDITYHPSAVLPDACYADCDGAVIADRDLLDLYTVQLPPAARFPRPIFISGEAGTGKRLMAFTAFRWSGLPGRVSLVDCSRESAARLEALLIGDREGGTHGLVERAGDALILAHVDCLPLPLQARAAAGQTRLLLTSRLPLEVAQRDRRLHPELARRVFKELALPPLRFRARDALELFFHFVRELAPPWTRREPPRPDARALARLQHREWPGNVAELRWVVSNLVACGVAGKFGPEALAAFPADRFASSSKQRPGVFSERPAA